MIRVIPLIFVCLSGVGYAVYTAQFAHQPYETTHLQEAATIKAY